MPYKKAALVSAITPTMIGHGTTITGSITANPPGPPVKTTNLAGIPLAVSGCLVTCSTHPSVNPNVVLATTIKSFELNGLGLVRADDIATCTATVQTESCDQTINVE